jgi:hypothetical protein
MLALVMAFTGKHQRLIMHDGGMALVSWLANLFNPPPLGSMNRGQKVGRICLVALTLFFGCVVAAILGTLGLWMAGQARAAMQVPTGLEGMTIVVVGLMGNILCLRTLLAIRRND